jgi:CBS-domain-containing membrane protein
VNGKADWLGHGLPREGENADHPYAGELADADPPTCALADGASSIDALLQGSRYGFCVVTSAQRVVLGRVRRSALASASRDSTAESLMEPGPSTVRPNTAVDELVERLTKRELRTAIVTTPTGRLLGVFHRSDGERYLRERGSGGA